MNLEELESAWREQERDLISTTDPHALAQKIRTQQRRFKRTIFWRDTREVGSSVFLVPFFIFCGWVQSIWGWYVLAAAVLVPDFFLLAGRLRQRRGEPRFGQSVLAGIEFSLGQVDHQIWLLRNVFWWYLLPLSIGFATAFLHVTLVLFESLGFSWFTLGMFLLLTTICTIVLGLIYKANQLAVRMVLQPRRDELAGLLEHLRASES